MTPLEKRRILDIDRQLRALRAEHRRSVESWKVFHRLRRDIEELSKILEDERDSLAQGQLMLPVPLGTKVSA